MCPIWLHRITHVWCPSCKSSETLHSFLQTSHSLPQTAPHPRHLCLIAAPGHSALPLNVTLKSHTCRSHARTSCPHTPLAISLFLHSSPPHPHLPRHLRLIAALGDYALLPRIGQRDFPYWREGLTRPGCSAWPLINENSRCCSFKATRPIPDRSLVPPPPTSTQAPATPGDSTVLLSNFQNHEPLFSCLISPT